MSAYIPPMSEIPVHPDDLDLSNVQSMQNMFRQCKSFNAPIDLDLSKCEQFDVKEVIEFLSTDTIKRLGLLVKTIPEQVREIPKGTRVKL